MAQYHVTGYMRVPVEGHIEAGSLEEAKKIAIEGKVRDLDDFGTEYEVFVPTLICGCDKENKEESVELD